MAVAVRMAGLRGVPGSQTTLVRFVFGLLVVFVVYRSGGFRLLIHRPWLLAGRGFFGGLAILCYFLSLAAAEGEGRTTLTNAVFLGNSYFIYIPVFGALFIRERLRMSTAAVVVVALAGLFMVSRPNLGDLRSGDLYGFLAGISGGMAMVTVRELRKTESHYVIFLSLCLFGALAGAAGMLAQKPVAIDAIGWMLLVVMGVTATAGQLAMTYAMRWSGAGEAGVIQMTTVVYSSAVGILWFGDPFNARILIGGILVLAAGTYISFVHGSD